MMLLAQEMQQLIQKGDLKIEVRAAQPPQQPIPHVQPQQPIPHVQPREKTCMEQYEELKAGYEVLEERWHEVNRALTVVASHLDEIANQIAQLPWPISKVPAAFLTSITWSSMANAGTPFVIAYIAWVLGIVMACVGFIWLALVQRVFLAPPDCYLRTST